VRIDRHEFDVPVLVHLKLAERSQFADLATRFIERKWPAQRLEFSGEAEHRAVQFHLIEACRDRQRLLDDKAGRIAGHRIETEFELPVRILLVPGRLVGGQVHAEIDGIFEVRGRHIGEHVLKPLGADILLEKFFLEARIDRKQHFELDADVGDIAQKGNVVRRVAEMDYRIRLGVCDVVDDDGVVGRFGRDALIVDDLDWRAGILDELAEGVGLRAREFVGRVKDRDFLDAERSYRSTQLAYRQSLASYMTALEQLKEALGTRNLP